MSDKIDIVVCYHKPSMVFQSDALKPMQLGKADAKIDLGFRGDDTGDNISSKNKYYAEDTALYWLWKNSKAEIKGLMHYRRLLDLKAPDVPFRQIVLEDIKSVADFVDELGLTSDIISEIMKSADIITQKKQNLHTWFNGNVYEQYGASHIQEHIDWAAEIIKVDFPEIWPSVNKYLNSNMGYFQNLCVMKAADFDAMCEFRFAVLNKLEKMIDVNRPEIADGWRYTSRWAAFVGERITGFYIEYLRGQGRQVAEYGRIDIAPKGMNIWETKSFVGNAYIGSEISGKPAAIEPLFGKNAVAAMLATNDTYLPYCSVMIRSIIENADPRKKYDLVVAMGSDVSEHKKKMLESMVTNNVSIRVIHSADILGQRDFFIRAHFSRDLYVKLFMPDLFMKYDKVLWLDSDMVVLRDIADLYETDIGDNWWGVAKELLIPVKGFVHGTLEQKMLLPYIRNTLRMNSVFHYFNTGVVLWNIRQCVKDNVLDLLLVKLDEIKNPYFVEQDIINSAANGKNVFWLSGAWNVAWNPAFHWTEGAGIIAYENAMHNLENPFIVHYCGSIKPWAEAFRPNAHYFWQYARNVPFYEMLIQNLMVSSVNKLESRIVEYQSKVNKLENRIVEYQSKIPVNGQNHIQDGASVKGVKNNKATKIKITPRKIIKYFLPYGFVRFYRVHAKKDRYLYRREKISVAEQNFAPNNKVSGKRKTTVKKLIKYLLPYGFVRLIQELKKNKVKK